MNETSSRPVTSVDVARAAGVSQATVSYVLNDNPHARVSEETRQRVRDAAARLGYVPDASARTLRTGRSGIVLLPLAEARIGPLVQAMLDDMEEEFRSRGYTLVQYGERRLTGVAAAKSWLALRPAAVIVEAGRLTRKSVDLLRSSGTRTVIAFSDEASPLVPAVVMPHEATGACAARHLVERGCTRLAAIVPKEPGIDRMGERRLSGVRAVFPAARRIDLAFSEEEAGRIAAGSDLPDGIFAYNDEYAMLLISALQDAGVRVPEDVAVVGADDLPLARLMRPRLTTVHFDASATPAEMVAIIDGMVKGERESVPGTVMTLMNPRLVVRDSA
ncbi:LacI family DNA-binding transcriptional regulator [Nonomuraea sediminis]|uniref:LacI family DNA-binding transcriptional regulator n=1 Tax=Nonomuraea sediminis TaxID=2835864 RepID=UPI001BDC5E77|nr:LacI family DNA-binding transcriptional regulator [Nonomuraea sediminis]